MYKIGLFSKMNRITIKTLRYYDEVGLLKPAHIDGLTGYRYYTTAQLPLLHEILSLRQLGLSIEDIKRVREGDDLRKILLNRKEALLKSIDENIGKLSQVVHYLDERTDVAMTCNIIIKELPEITVAYWRLIIPNYEALSDLMPEMDRELDVLGCRRTEPIYCFNSYHDGEYKEEDIDVEVCESIVEAKIENDFLKFKKLPKVPEAVCILHKGPYTSLAKAYGAALTWIEGNGYELSGLPRESYIDGSWNKTDADEWLTEIQCPIRKKN